MHVTKRNRAEQTGRNATRSRLTLHLHLQILGTFIPCHWTDSSACLRIKQAPPPLPPPQMRTDSSPGLYILDLFILRNSRPPTWQVCMVGPVGVVCSLELAENFEIRIWKEIGVGILHFQIDQTEIPRTPDTPPRRVTVR